MKYRKFYAGILALAASGIIAGGIVSAHGFPSGATSDEMAARHEAMFEAQANMLGVSVSDVKAGWAAGKTVVQIAAEHGITKEQLSEKMRSVQVARMQAVLQTLVSKGVITQTQADARFSAAQSHAGKGRMMGFFGHGMAR